jgi:hypothetical protein
VVEGLRRVDGDPAREEPLGAINAAPFDLGGVVLRYRPGKNQGADEVLFMIVQAVRSFKPVVRPIKMARQ